MRRNRTFLAGVGVLSVVVLVAVAWANLEKRGMEETQVKQWSSPPAMALDLQKQYYATIKTEKGDIRIQLFADKAPVTVNSFVFLARQHFYDNTTFHRVLPGFVAQAGDPTGTGAGSPGYQFADEFHPDLRHDSAGIVAMANSGANTNGSQFYITYAPEPQLDDHYSVFGKVVSGMDVVDALTPRNPEDNPTFSGDRIITIEIEEVS
jgi:cyclophilin family peptidyl-prolyl cis-trans isomerase